MSNPSYNKWKSTTIYGNLSVRDLTNSSGTSVVEVANVDLSGNFLSRGDSTFTKAVECNGTISNANHLTTKSFADSNYLNLVDASNTYLKITDASNDYLKLIDASNNYATQSYVNNAVSSGGGSSLLGSNNSWTGTNSYNTYFPVSTLPTSTSITNNSIVNKGMLDTIYQTISGMSSYLTSSTAASTYQTISGMSFYLTTSAASSTYQTIADMTNYLTANTANSTYQTITGMSSYLTTSAASSTYQTIANMSNYFSLTGNNIAIGNNTFSNAVTCNGTISNANHLTTKSYVDSVSGGASLTGSNTFSGLSNTFTNSLFCQKEIINSSRYRIGVDNSIANPSITLIGETLITSTNTASVAYLNDINTITYDFNYNITGTFITPAQSFKQVNLNIAIATNSIMSIYYTSTGSLSSVLTIGNVYFDVYSENVLYSSTIATNSNSNSLSYQINESCNPPSWSETGSVKAYLTNFTATINLPYTATNSNTYIAIRTTITGSLTRNVQSGDKTSTGSFTPRLLICASSSYSPAYTYISGPGSLNTGAGLSVSPGAAGTGWSYSNAPTKTNDITYPNTSYFYDLRANNIISTGLCGGYIMISASYNFTGLKVPSIILHSNLGSNNYNITFPNSGIPDGQIIILKKVNSNNVVAAYTLFLSANNIVSLAGNINGSGSSFNMSSSITTLYFVVVLNTFYIILQQ